MFGKVVSGHQLVHRIESFGSPNGRPRHIIRIIDSGQLLAERGEVPV